SINYSKKIQQAIFPQTDLLKNYYKDSFIYNKPKDKIGGDFPWVKKQGNSLYLGVVDCTGHGVPGALMSVVTYFLIDKINNQVHDFTPSEILNHLHLNVNRKLGQHFENADCKDGADISLCKIDTFSNILEYSGAHRPLLIYRKGELIEIKGDKYPIGGMHYAKKRKRFVNNTFQLLKGDIVLMFSDGYTDQFGSTENERVQKYGMRRVRELLNEETDWNMAQLENYIINELNTWKGMEKQTDDILIVGVKI
ncbi:MAG: SpoIIE family protein phosphatase, partial [Cyclobacteriaceae bacterium]|nr:SpoIIE family protein phosphatase [Cyclobacteriaceae bacterium]